jgi:transcriptional regulator of acetoin/glycerol metabolism
MLTTTESIKISILDQTSSGETLNKIKLEFQTATVKLRDIISGRVRLETKNLLDTSKKPKYSFIERTEVEKLGSNLTNITQLQDKKVEYALEMFQKNGYLVLIDDHQATSLDQEVKLTNNTEITFLKLVPLISG